MFGVVLRFRENEVAISSDLSKMYHRVLIPERDQHVHRYVWGNFETSRDPDVYVKTVLTFGDKPASAGEQIALQKTEKEKSKFSPSYKVLEEQSTGKESNELRIFQGEFEE